MTESDALSKLRTLIGHEVAVHEGSIDAWGVLADAGGRVGRELVAYTPPPDSYAMNFDDIARVELDDAGVFHVLTRLGRNMTISSLSGSERAPLRA